MDAFIFSMLCLAVVAGVVFLLAYQAEHSEG